MGFKEILQQYGPTVGPFIAVFAIILMNSGNKKKNIKKKLDEKKADEIEEKEGDSTLFASLTLLFVVILIFFTFKYGLKGLKNIYSFIEPLINYLKYNFLILFNKFTQTKLYKFIGLIFLFYPLVGQATQIMNKSGTKDSLLDNTEKVKKDTKKLKIFNELVSKLGREPTLEEIEKEFKNRFNEPL